MSLEFAAEVLSGFDGSSEVLRPHTAADAVYALAKKQELSVEEETLLARDMAPLTLHAVDRGVSCWGTHFGPFFERTMEDGSQISVPDLSEISESTIQSWIELANQLQHPVLKARYADAVWDLQPRFCPSMKRPYAMAALAVDAYIDAVKASLLPSDIEAADASERALVVSAQLNDSSRKNAATELVLELAESAALDSPGVWLVPFRAFNSLRTPGPELQQRMIVQLEKRLVKAADEGNGYCAEAASDALRKLYSRQERSADRHRVLRVYSATLLSQAKSMDAFVAIARLEPLAAQLEAEGLQSEAEEIRLEMERRGPESLAGMHEHSVEVQIDRAEINAQLDKILNVEHPFAALYRLANSQVPKPDKVRLQLAETSKQFVFQRLFTTAIIGNDGLPKATIGPADSDPEGHLVKEATRQLSLSGLFFEWGLQRWKEKFALRLEEVKEMTSGSLLLSKASEKLIRSGLTAHENQDYEKSISVLCTQVEAMLRELLKVLGIPVSRGKRGSIELKNMNDVLSDTRVVEALSEDLLFYLKVLYVDKRGLNLRNELAHALLPSDSFNLHTSCLVVMSTILLAMIRPEAVFMTAENPEQEALPS